mgnify:CR=1 FL=1
MTGYGYDAVGNLTSVTYPDGSEETYIYDEQDRLIIHVDASGNKTHRLYDANGDTLVTRTIDRMGEVTKFGYDDNGMLVSMTRGDRVSELSYDSGSTSCRGRRTERFSATGNMTIWGV